MKISREKTVKEISCQFSRFDKSYGLFHWHENIEICQVLNKSCDFLIDGEVIKADEGDIVVINGHTVHRFLVGEDGVFIKIFQISPKALLNTNMSIKSIRRHITAEEIRHIPEFQKRFDDLIKIVEQDGGAATARENCFMQSISAAIYFLLMQNFADNSEVKTKKESRIFFEIVEYVNMNFTEDISVSLIAEKMYMQRGKVGNIFLKYSGMTLNDYLNTVRIKNVNKMLDIGVSITEAAMESGFQNVRTLNNVYKKITGITPTEYIKANKKA